MVYLTRRVLQAIPLLLLLSALLFIMVRAAPGGPLAAAQRNPNVTPEQIARLKIKLGLDQPLPVQYLKWLSVIVLEGDFGESIKFHRPVTVMLAERIPNTLLLAGLGFALTLLLAIPIGVLSARWPYSPFDYFVTTLTFIGQSIPVFWLGLALILIFYVGLKNPFTGTPLFPLGGMHTPGQENNLVDLAWHLVLPVSALSFGWVAWYSRFLRASMLDVLHTDYIRTARAKGASNRRVYYHHALRNGILPLVTLIALDLPTVFSGALFVETIFSWPGMGRLFWEAANGRDYPVLLAVVMIDAVLIVACNVLADGLYALLDPRVRYD